MHVHVHMPAVDRLTSALTPALRGREIGARAPRQVPPRAPQAASEESKPQSPLLHSSRRSSSSAAHPQLVVHSSSAVDEQLFGTNGYSEPAGALHIAPEGWAVQVPQADRTARV